ncbi:MAG: ABC transporter substrate-binding protein [bacterium]
MRQAITKTLQRQNLVDVLLNGQGRLIPGPLPPYFWAYNESLPVDVFNPEEARNLLELAGWSDRDGDGVRENNGRPWNLP